MVLAVILAITLRASGNWTAGFERDKNVVAVLARGCMAMVVGLATALLAYGNCDPVLEDNNRELQSS